jgi:hypothetical protein
MTWVAWAKAIGTSLLVSSMTCDAKQNLGRDRIGGVSTWAEKEAL